MNRFLMYSFIVLIFASPLIYSNFVYQSSPNFLNPYNFIIFILASAICFFSFVDIRKHGIRAHNLFLFTFYVFLFWNTSNLGGIQLEKEAIDVYYYFFGPLIFAGMLWVFCTLKVRQMDDLVKFKLDPNLLALILLSIFVLVKLYIGSVVGYRIESVEAGFLEEGDKFSVPGFTGIATVLQWTLVMLMPHIKRKYIVLILVFVIVFAFLHVKRGDISRIFVFMIVWFFFVKVRQKNYFSFKRMIVISSVFLSFSLIFAEFGEWRRSNQLAKSIIQTYLDSKSESIVLNWTYSYTSIGYDIMKISDDMAHPYFPYGITFPYLDQGSFQMKNYTAEQEKANINGFNAGTFLSLFIHDYGILYFLEIILFGFLVGLLILITRMFNFFGIYCMVLTLLVFCFFGNYFINIGLVNSFILSIILFNFIRIDKKHEI